MNEQPLNEQLLLFMCVFSAVATVGYIAARVLLGSADGRLRDRLASGFQGSAQATSRDLRYWLQWLGQLAAEPFMPKSREKQSALRQRLSCAGLYQPAALKLVVGSKMIFLAAGVGVGYLLGAMLESPVFGTAMGGLVGYVLPLAWLRIRISKHQVELTDGVADALDLMVVCVEAGLTIDAAIQRVGQELALPYPALSRELEIAHMETRVGLARAEALKNLGQRTGNIALQSLASMLIQADRFGTSISNALRVHAQSLRATRQLAAEELAAKASVKMSFPLVLFIFPATFLVLAGPTIINLINSPLFKD